MNVCLHGKTINVYVGADTPMSDGLEYTKNRMKTENLSKGFLIYDGLRFQVGLKTTQERLWARYQERNNRGEEREEEDEQ